MRNLLGGLIACISGVISIWALLDTAHYSWPEPFSTIGILFEGAFLLSLYGLPNMLDNVIPFLMSWIIAGFFIGILSTSVSNITRTNIWTGIILFILLVSGRLLQEPEFWQDPARNYFLLEWVLRCIVISFIGFLSAIPTRKIVEALSKEDTVLPPEKIESTCSCGAIYKSRPVICAACGKTMEYDLTLSRDSSTE